MNIKKMYEKVLEQQSLFPEIRWALTNNVFTAFRYGSKKFFETIIEAKKYQHLYDLTEAEQEILNSDIGEFAEFEGEQVPLDLPLALTEKEKAEYQGRDVDLNKPEKGNVSKFKVYVRNDKGNVVKVNFGLNVTLSDIKDPAKRKAFTSRHNCEQAKDKTTPSYWACRTPRFYCQVFNCNFSSEAFW